MNLLRLLFLLFFFPSVLPGRCTVGCPLLQVCTLGWVKCREHISLLIILCIIVYVTNKAHPSLICNLYLYLCCLLLLGTEHRWCEDPIESAPFIRDRAPMVQRTLLNLLRLLLGTEHRWCEDPIESAPFIIRDRALMVRGPY